MSSTAPSNSPPPHPLSPLSRTEFITARNAAAAHHDNHQLLHFRAIHLEEPLKADLIPFLEAEHARADAAELKKCRPPRQAVVEYDLLRPAVGDNVSGKRPIWNRVVVRLNGSGVEGKDKGTAEVVERREEEGDGPYPGFTIEWTGCEDLITSSPLFKEAMAEFELPPGFRIVIDGWPYGGTAAEDEKGPMIPYLFQALIFARDGSRNSLDSNHYAYPIPLIAVIDRAARRVVRVDRLATGGRGDDGEMNGPRSSFATRELQTGIGTATHNGPEANSIARDETQQNTTKPKRLFENHSSAKYVPELRDSPPRAGLRPLTVLQPEGASFAAHADGLVEWQRWRFRVGFTPREGAVLHDVCHDGRPVAYRLSFSELTVPYADPRSPFHRKQAFDLGDGGFGRTANSLALGCDCLGAIHYFDAWLANPNGEPNHARSVVCLHEQDAGLLWKHTNPASGRAVVARARELVVQFVCTLANYEYVLAFKLDLAGVVTLETRATGILSVVAIDPGKASDYGAVVSHGILAQNHQHIFAARIDPAVDSYRAGDTQVLVEETRPAALDPATNPHGNLYRVCRNPVDRATWVDAEPRLNRMLRLENAHKKNRISGNNVAYKLVAPASQMLLAHEDSVAARRSPFARHNTWVTGFRDGELWAGGEFTNQSCAEAGGVAAMVKRGDWFTDAGEKERDEHPASVTEGNHNQDAGKRSSPVVWAVYGFTHNPRVEDWPVMPSEAYQIHLRPSDFFECNPAIDVASPRDESSVLIPCCDGAASGLSADKDAGGAAMPAAPNSHLGGTQGRGIDAKEAGAHVAERTNGF